MNTEESNQHVESSLEEIGFKGEVLKELAARHRVYRAVRDISAEYVQEDFYWLDENALGEKAIFAAAEEFACALVQALSSQETDAEYNNALANYIAQIWPPDVAAAFDADTGILDLRQL